VLGEGEREEGIANIETSRRRGGESAYYKMQALCGHRECKCSAVPQCDVKWYNQGRRML
jgi:hypothetical protein